ncbi:hypothetical protein IC582_030307 [Cucumis melo]
MGLMFKITKCRGLEGSNPIHKVLAPTNHALLRSISIHCYIHHLFSNHYGLIVDSFLHIDHVPVFFF